jgi:hypothetical protein
MDTPIRSKVIPGIWAMGLTACVLALWVEGAGALVHGGGLILAAFMLVLFPLLGGAWFADAVGLPAAAQLPLGAVFEFIYLYAIVRALQAKRRAIAVKNEG